MNYKLYQEFACVVAGTKHGTVYTKHKCWFLGFDENLCTRYHNATGWAKYKEEKNSEGEVIGDVTEYYSCGLRHRLDGPAYEVNDYILDENQYQLWGRLHRDVGPAHIIWGSYGWRIFYVHGINLTEIYQTL